MERAKALEIGRRAEQLLAPLLAEYGVKAKVKSARYGDTTVILKIECATDGPDGEIGGADADALRRSGFEYGLPPDGALGARFDWLGEQYVLAGLRPRSRKYPFVATRTSDGKRFKMPEKVVVDALGRKDGN